MTNDKLVSKVLEEINRCENLTKCIKIIYKLWLDIDVNEDNDSKWVYLKTQRGLCDFVEEILEENHPSEKYGVVILYHRRLLFENIEFSAYPFGIKNFNRRKNNATQHLDPDRAAWVHKVLLGEFKNFEDYYKKEYVK